VGRGRPARELTYPPSSVAKKVVIAKKRCCQSGPRCKRCPIVLRRLERVDLARRVDRRTYVLSADLRKRHLRAARLD
jgi:hypothetical protein